MSCNKREEKSGKDIHCAKLDANQEDGDVHQTGSCAMNLQQWKIL